MELTFVKMRMESMDIEVGEQMTLVPGVSMPLKLSLSLEALSVNLVA